MLNIGKNVVEGIWQGISNGFTWIKNKIKKWVGDVLGFIKNLFGIHSPSTLFRDQIGNNLALGIGEGFSDTMKDVSNDMANAIPTNFETDMNISTIAKNINPQNSEETNYKTMVSAFKEALKEMKIQLDDREVGNFVDTRLSEVV